MCGMLCVSFCTMRYQNTCKSTTPQDHQGTPAKWGLPESWQHPLSDDSNVRSAMCRISVVRRQSWKEWTPLCVEVLIIYDFLIVCLKPQQLLNPSKNGRCSVCLSAPPRGRAGERRPSTSHSLSIKDGEDNDDDDAATLVVAAAVVAIVVIAIASFRGLTLSPPPRPPDEDTTSRFNI